jgi:outer membrane immunogenic protein
VAPAPVYNWTGFYIGGHIGGAFQDNNNVFGGNNDGRFIGGGQVGADYQFSGSWLVGAEAQYSYVDRNNDNTFLFRAATLITVCAASLPSPAAPVTPGVRACCT